MIKLLEIMLNNREYFVSGLGLGDMAFELKVGDIISEDEEQLIYNFIESKSPKDVWIEKESIITEWEYAEEWLKQQITELKNQQL